MTPEQQKIWMDKSVTAISGAAILSQLSAREVARHALKSLFSLNGSDREASLALVQKIEDFAVRRRLLEVFRRSFVEISETPTSDIFFQAGSFSDAHFADLFDRELLALWRRCGQDKPRFDALIKAYPNAARLRIAKRLTSRAFAQRRRIRHAVNGVFASSGRRTSTMINLLAILIFIGLIVIMFDK